MSASPFPGSTLHGTWPEPYALDRDEASGVLRLRTPFYEVEHALRQGGAIQAVRCLGGSGENLLLAPLACEVTVSGSAAPFSALCETACRVQARVTPEGARVEVEGNLRAPDGQTCGVEYGCRYDYHWGAIRLCQRLRFPPGGVRVSRLSLLQGRLRPDLGAYGVRPGAPAEASPDPAAFGVCQWGRLRPGASFDCPYESRFVPRYVVCADPGREGLEWFAASELGQWDYQVAGRPGCGHLYLGPQSRPPAVRLSIAPLSLPRGDVALTGEYVFESWIGLPVISGRAHTPFLHTAFQRHPWPTAQTIRGWAERGIRTAHFHHDGDTFRDGLFWRDGSYPPFGPQDMAEYDRVIRTCQEHGIRVATYFSNKELHPSTAAYQQHGARWARLPGDRGEQLHNLYSGDEYGAQMCLRSGWLDQLKKNIDTVLTRHPLNGVYYDWNVALYCHNAEHGTTTTACAPQGGAPGCGGHAFSPAGHWDVDELVELMEWTRRRVGREGLVIVHNTMVPCAVTENLADHVVAMEWGYGRLASAAPDLSALPLEWNFLGARPRGVIGYGCLEPGAPEGVHRQMTLRCLLTGTAPWPAQDLDLEIFAPLKEFDLSGYRFRDWRTAPVGLEGQGAAAAAYVGPDGAVIVVANLTGEARRVRASLDALAAGLAEGAWVGRPVGTAGGAQPAERMVLDLPADGAVVLRVERGT
ncbi:MAG: DUF6259 domain-containing protein [Candidatus Latescibacterota bacterium]